MTTQTVKLNDHGFTGASCNQLLRHVYVEWMNNYLTVDLFAEHHEMTVEDAQELLNLGRKAMKNNDMMEKVA